MKSLFLSICILLFITTIHAQSPIRYEVTSGINFSKYLSADLNYTTGFRIGISAELGLSSISEKMYVNSALLLTQKGGKGDVNNFKINAYYLELPVHIGLKQRLSGKFSFFEEVGPYIAFGMYGKTKSDGYYSSFSGEQDGFKYNTFSKTGLKRWDLGGGFKVGTEYMNHIRLSWGMDFGLIKVSKVSSAKNFNTYFALSYLF